MTGFWPGSGIFPGASGPLGGVVHWLGTFPSFWPVSGIFRGASGPLARRFSWILAWFLAFFRELVVHSTEWTTGAGLFTDFGLVSAVA